MAQFVDCYWFLEKQAGDTSLSRPKLNPDPAAHLIIAETHQGYRYGEGPEAFVGHGSHWIFPHRKTIEMDHSAPFVVLGIKFHVGALYSLDFSLPQAVLDQVVAVDVNTMLKSSLFITTELLAEASLKSQHCCNSLDGLLKPWLLGRHQDQHSQLVHRALALLPATPISKMGAALHCSQRTVERSFLRVTGFTLKQCHSMNKLEAMLAYLYTLDADGVNWADVAAKFEFSDQPHLIRYLSSSIGSTPGAYARERNIAIDVYGDFEAS